jgi:hypothetical protein
MSPFTHHHVSDDKKLDKVLAMMTEEFGKLHLKLNLLTQHARDVSLVLFQQQRNHSEKRMEFSRHTKNVIRRIVSEEPFCGRCPCCFTQDVLSEGTTAERAQFDHFYGPAFNKPEFAWLICGTCHVSLSTSQIMRQNVVSQFHHFQAFVTDHMLHRSNYIPIP